MSLKCRVISTCEMMSCDIQEDGSDRALAVSSTQIIVIMTAGPASGFQVGGTCNLVCTIWSFTVELYQASITEDATSVNECNGPILQDHGSRAGVSNEGPGARS